MTAIDLTDDQWSDIIDCLQSRAKKSRELAALVAKDNWLGQAHRDQAARFDALADHIEENY